MNKTKFKFLLVIILFVLSISNLSFATNETSYSDLYVSSNEDFKSSEQFNSNLFLSVKDVEINPTTNTTVNGNLFITANTVTIKSDIIYSENEYDNIGNPKISINSISSISGNVFVMANKFILEPGCEIKGDLYVCANEIYLGQNAKISGNVFASANYFNLNAVINYSLYANAKNFNMEYYGYVNRDLTLNSETANINGYIYGNSFINAKEIVLKDKFINEKNFTVDYADNVTLAGEIKGNANINSKNITFDNENNICIIRGDLNYSSKNEIQVPDGIVSKNINYSKYKSNTNVFFNYIQSLIPILIFALLLYYIIKKIKPSFSDSIGKITLSKLFKSIGIGFAMLILTPIVIVLLLVSGIGIYIGLLLLIIYLLVLILCIPIFIISLAVYLHSKFLKHINVFILITLLSIILCLIDLIPYVAFLVSFIKVLFGIGLVLYLIKTNQQN